ncbi:DUF4870 domain-containing protein [Maribacter algarum]|uniref:DUF4870 domain-containing protein n=1 Tax=Maribacter algarum (ex Zhang et al. 2020) TaxID=2578118 RepID=A0A5S3PGN0_9FLAO|nr:DUF4870 domain-containing protein [Maribacter algarum]TMM53283.1 DUF4870 domain-containing protein [Maribacter algarum]
MSIFKQIRKKNGFTQMELSKKTGLSLRTIQRLDVSDKAPIGHTLKVLSEVFNLEPIVLLKKFNSIQKREAIDNLSIKYINLSVLAFLGLPFGNIILPFLMWKNKRNSKIVDEAGRRIINIQILWSIVLCLLLCLSPLMNIVIASSLPLSLVILSIAILINLIIIVKNARALQRNSFAVLNPPIRFL